MRSYIRYPSRLPVELRLGDVVADESNYLNNVSQGGLSFNSMLPIAIGTLMELRIPPNRPLFQMLGKVAWCKSVGLHHVVGVEFVGTDQEAGGQLVAMACEIENYRAAETARGRRLTSQEAALEWIARHGEQFQAGMSEPPGDHSEPV